MPGLGTGRTPLTAGSVVTCEKTEHLDALVFPCGPGTIPTIAGPTVTVPSRPLGPNTQPPTVKPLIITNTPATPLSSAAPSAATTVSATTPSAVKCHPAVLGNANTKSNGEKDAEAVVGGLPSNVTVNVGAPSLLVRGGKGLRG